MKDVNNTMSQSKPRKKEPFIKSEYPEFGKLKVDYTDFDRAIGWNDCCLAWEQHLQEKLGEGLFKLIFKSKFIRIFKDSNGELMYRIEADKLAEEIRTHILGEGDDDGKE